MQYNNASKYANQKTTIARKVARATAPVDGHGIHSLGGLNADLDARFTASTSPMDFCHDEYPGEPVTAAEAGPAFAPLDD